MTDKMREEFEAWHKAQVTRLLEHGEPTAAGVWRSMESMYWEAWKASRESVAVPHFCGYKFEGCQYYDADSVDEALEDLGLKVKP